MLLATVKALLSRVDWRQAGWRASALNSGTMCPVGVMYVPTVGSCPALCRRLIVLGLTLSIVAISSAVKSVGRAVIVRSF
jgi:hypothetical protein